MLSCRICCARCRFASKMAARVLALPLGPRHFVARRVLLALQPLELGNQAAAPVFERRQLLELAVRVHAAALQAAFHVLLMLSHVSRIQHA